MPVKHKYKRPRKASKRESSESIAQLGRSSATAQEVIGQLTVRLLNDLPAADSAAGRLFHKWRASRFLAAEESERLRGLTPAQFGGTSWKVWQADGALDALGLLFCLETYYALAVKMLTRASIARRQATMCAPPATDLSLSPVRWYLESIESDQAFHVQGWSGMPEARMFGWYLESADDQLLSALGRMRRVTESIADSWLSAAQDETQDRFRDLYLDLLRRQARHRLGEFYTPSWLARWLLDQLEQHAGPVSRVLDPCCGSGVFVIEALRRLRTAHPDLADLGTDAFKLEQSLVAGVDIHALAVASSRANYAIATADLLPRNGDVWDLPIVHADAITGELQVPPGGGDPDGHVERSLGKFQQVVGNPPWVGWESLPQEYRLRTAELWKQHGLFAHRGMDTILGKGRKDLSMLMSYIVSDRFLADGGCLAFVMTCSAFRNSGAGAGFLEMRLRGGDGSPLELIRVDDFSQLQLFEGANTRACTFVWRKGLPTRYPIPYHRWARESQENQPALSDAMQTPLGQLESNRLWADVHHGEQAHPSWIVGDRDLLGDADRLLRRSDYRAYEGANTGGANGIYWLEILGPSQKGLLRVRNLADAGKLSLPELEFEVESDLVYPLIRGSQMRRWASRVSTGLLLVQDPQSRRGMDIETLRDHYPLAWQYLSQFEGVLRRRAAYQRFFQRGGSAASGDKAPFYSMFNIGSYTMSDHKVAWHRMRSPLAAAVLEPLEGKPVMPQETHAFIPTDSLEESLFVAAMINSKRFQYLAESISHAGGKSFASPHLLTRIAVPKFDPTDPLHVDLSNHAREIYTIALSRVAAGGDSGIGSAAEDQLLEPLVDHVW